MAPERRQVSLHVGEQPGPDQRGTKLLRLPAPTNADVVYAGTEGFYKSTDGGKTFRSIRSPHSDNHDMWINPKNGKLSLML